MHQACQDMSSTLKPGLVVTRYQYKRIEFRTELFILAIRETIKFPFSLFDPSKSLAISSLVTVCDNFDFFPRGFIRRVPKCAYVY